MAITINVSGVTGGNKQSQPQQPPISPTPSESQQTVQSDNQAQPIQPQPSSNNEDGNIASQNQTERIVYQRPDFSQYVQSKDESLNSQLPTSERMVGDISGEISRRGIVLVPGTANYSSMLNMLQQQQHTSVMGQVESQYKERVSDIDNRKDNLIQEIKARLEAARKSEISSNEDPDKDDEINKKYDKKLDRETKAAAKFFQKEYDSEEKRHNSEVAEAEQRIAEAIRKIIENLTNQQRDTPHSAQTTPPIQYQQTPSHTGQETQQSQQQPVGGQNATVQQPTIRPTDSKGDSKTEQASSPSDNRQAGYERPDFNLYSTGKYNGADNSVLPTSDRLVSSIQAEISRRGIVIMPDTTTEETSKVLDELKQNQRDKAAGAVNRRIDDYLEDVGNRYNGLDTEIKKRIEAERQSELAEASPQEVAGINKKWSNKLDSERETMSKRFDAEMNDAELARSSQLEEVEQRIAEAFERIVSNTAGKQPKQQTTDNSGRTIVDAEKSDSKSALPYQRPDFSQYAPISSTPATSLPSSDRIVDDIKAEISKRGITLVPDAPNIDKVVETLGSNQRDSLIEKEDSQYNARMSDIDNRRDSLMYEINSRLEASRQSELAATKDPAERKRINDEYDRLANDEEQHATRYFQKEFDSEEKRHGSEVAEAERRIAEAIQRILSNIPQSTQQQTANQPPQPQPAPTQPIQQPPQPQPAQPIQQPNNGGLSNSNIPPSQSANSNNSGNGSNAPVSPNRFVPYQRPDFKQYSYNGQSPVNSPLPTSDRLVNDVRAEISRRGIILVPGTQNFSTMLNTMQQNQRATMMGQIDNQRDARLQDIDKRADSLMDEIKKRVDVSRASELAGADPLDFDQINSKWDRKLERERNAAGAMFAKEEAAVNAEYNAQTAEAEQRLTEAIQRLTEELSQGNKDSYLNNLRDKYKEQIWR